VDEFPTLPTIYLTLSDVMANPRSTVEHAANIISKDQAATSKVLKTANSSIYGIRGRVSTISQAIFYIGFNEVKNLVIAISIMKMFDNVKTLNNINPVDLWKHSIGVGVISRILGKILGIRQLEDYFIAGILHDIGKLLFFKTMPEEYSKVVNYAHEKRLTYRDAESSHFGVSHTLAGEMLAEKWKLPKSLRSVIGNHYSGFVDGKLDMLVSIVHLADVIAHILEFGRMGDEIIPEPNLLIWEFLKFSEKQISTLAPVFIRDYEETVDLLLIN